MVEVTEQQFDEFMEAGIAAVPEQYRSRIDNVAIMVADNPSEQQRKDLKLACNQTLFGLYEGVPLPQRGGRTKLLPDKITVFKVPILRFSQTEDEVKEQVKHTIWHEVAHYFGLDHKRIHEIDGRH